MEPLSERRAAQRPFLCLCAFLIVSFEKNNFALGPRPSFFLIKQKPCSAPVAQARARSLSLLSIRHLSKLTRLVTLTSRTRTRTRRLLHTPAPATPHPTPHRSAKLHGRATIKGPETERQRAGETERRMRMRIRARKDGAQARMRPAGARAYGMHSKQRHRHGAVSSSQRRRQPRRTGRSRQSYASERCTSSENY